MKALACGHEPSPHSEHTTGTAILPDGREVCWDCSDAWVRQRMVVGETIGGYLSGDCSKITTWNGTALARVTSSVVRRVGFGRVARTYFTAIDPTGKRWHGQSPGGNMYATMRPLRVRK